MLSAAPPRIGPNAKRPLGRNEGRLLSAAPLRIGPNAKRRCRLAGMTLQSFPARAREDWRAALARSGMVRLTGVSLDADNRSLRAIGALLGHASTRALPWRAGLVEPGYVSRVEALPVAPLDQFGKPLKSAAADDFALHSDESFCAQPARFVLLHCWRADPAGGGTSLLLTREQILAAADGPTREALASIALPYPVGNFPVLAPGGLRFNAAEIDGETRARGRSASASESRWVREFEALFARLASQCRLASSDLLVIDNHRVLHGRTAFARGSSRLLKRLRIL